ncbi:MAG: inositol monophosphatase [Planctomycetes bacterium]|nr:inositol monophosphatase [Planctomycetota bacterium]
MAVAPIDVARSAAQAAGEIIARYFREGVTMRLKNPCDLVSDADVNAEQAIVDVVRAAFPGHAVLAEEKHKDSIDAEHLWVIDPLDGTTNFAHHIPHFGVSIAYLHRGVAQCGVIYNPLRDDWYTAERGAGAFHNGQRLGVSEHKNLNETLVGLGFYYDRGALMEATLTAVHALFQEQIHGVRRFGAASLDLCAVAEGLFGAFFEYVLSPWDYAAGKLLVEEAGGLVTTCTGHTLGLTRSSVLASNGHLHEAMLEVIARHDPGVTA